MMEEKSVNFLYIKKDKKQAQKRIILTKLFTTLQCQRKAISDKSKKSRQPLLYITIYEGGRDKTRTKDNDFTEIHVILDDNNG